MSGNALFAEVFLTDRTEVTMILTERHFTVMTDRSCRLVTKMNTPHCLNTNNMTVALHDKIYCQ